MTLNLAAEPKSLADELRARIEARTAKVAVLGLGYVGLPLAETFAWGGYPVIGFDIDSDKVARLRKGKATSATSAPTASPSWPTAAGSTRPTTRRASSRPTPSSSACRRRWATPASPTCPSSRAPAAP